MYIKKLRRKCSVRGCKNTDTFAVSLTREMGGSVIVCKSCLEKALKAVGEYDNIVPAAKTEITAAPPLFFNNTANEAETDRAYIGDDIKQETEAVFACPSCGKEFDSERGFKTHLRYCKSQTNENKGAKTE